MPRGSKQAKVGIWMVEKLLDMRVRGMMLKGEDVQVEGVIMEIVVMAGGNAVDLEMF